MNVGDRVFVTVFGEPRPARVLVPVTALGNIEVELDEPVEVAGVWTPIRQLVRAPQDVQPMRPDPTRVVREWEPPDDPGDVPVLVVADPAWRDALRGGPAEPFAYVRELVAIALALLVFFLLALWIIT